MFTANLASKAVKMVQSGGGGGGGGGVRVLCACCLRLVEVVSNKQNNPRLKHSYSFHCTVMSDSDPCPGTANF